MQSAMALHEIDDLPNAFPNAIANDEEQEFSAAEVALDVVDKAGLVHAVVAPTDKLVKHVPPLAQPPRHLAL